MKACVFSGLYNAAHNSFIITMIDLFKKLNIDTFALLDSNYSKTFTKKEKNNNRIDYLDAFDFSIKVDIIYIINQSKIDGKIIKKFKKSNPNIKVYFACHEPWNGWKSTFKNLFKKNESVLATIKLMYKFILLRKLLKNVQACFLFSKAGYERYGKYLKRFCNKFYLFPLPFKNENLLNNNGKKEYFSCIGSTALAHNFEGFVKTILDISKIDKDVKFLIATKDTISSDILEKIKFLINDNRLLLNHGKIMTNDEINNYYSISLAVWLYYNTSVQSGVLCKSFMFGSPVIASNIGSFKEFVINDFNGFVLDEQNSQMIYEKIQIIKDSIDTYKVNSITTFNNFFNYENQINKYKKVFLLEEYNV